jgi:trehalose/maltose transport system substrate-binding protein
LQSLPADQLALWRRLLQNPSEAPDVFAIDVIWPEMMADYALNLNPYLAETAADFPALVANDTVDGKLVAMPYHADAGSYHSTFREQFFQLRQVLGCPIR